MVSNSFGAIFFKILNLDSDTKKSWNFKILKLSCTEFSCKCYYKHMLIFSWLLTRRNVYNKTYGRNSGNVIVKGVTNITTSFIYLLYNLQNSIPLIFKYTNVQQMKIFPTNHYLFKLQSTVFTYLKHLSNAHFSTLIKPFCLVHYNTHKTYNNHPKTQKKNIRITR